ncbi:MAG TPA: aminoglycoside phosphotransferase family protein [Actinomycetes bacterium]|nr:aminoglycoside phosphotransferase family protein [Actinomycetes bacterium]
MTIEQWSSDAWRGEAEAWLDQQLAANGIQRVGEVTQPHLRPWATVLRAPTTRGVVWLKAAGAETAFEVELYGLLERVVPERILVPIARDAERGWMLLPDGGRRLGERLDELDLVEAMAEVLPGYGQLQRDLGPHTDELLGLGIADMRAAVMPRRFEEAVAAVGRYVGRHGNEGDRETLRRAEAMAGRFQGWCQRLGGAAVGASLDHNDLHFWNVFVDEGAGSVGRVRFYDWGDSVVAHPFASMLLGLGMIALQLEVTADDPAGAAAAGCLPGGVRRPGLARRAGRGAGAGLPGGQGRAGAELGPGVAAAGRGGGRRLRRRPVAGARVAAVGQRHRGRLSPWGGG